MLGVCNILYVCTADFIFIWSQKIKYFDKCIYEIAETTLNPGVVILN